jgi:hypothetical protein
MSEHYERSTTAYILQQTIYCWLVALPIEKTCTRASRRQMYHQLSAQNVVTEPIDGVSGVADGATWTGCADLSGPGEI